MAMYSPMISLYRFSTSTDSSSRERTRVLNYGYKAEYTNRINRTKFGIGTEMLPEIMEALDSFYLMDPTRSMTHKEGSPLLGGGLVTAPSLTQIWRDLDEIGWEEYPIGSIKTVQPAQLAAETFMAFPSISTSLTQVTTEQKVYVRKRRGKKIRKS